MRRDRDERGGGGHGRDRRRRDQRARERGRDPEPEPARDRGGREGRGGGGQGRGGGGHGGGGGGAPRIAVGATGNRPELVETIPIGADPAAGRVVALSLGPRTRSENPLPELEPGDRLLVFAELELTTDAEDPGHPGRIGNAYSYAPKVEASLVLASDPGALDGIELGSGWRQAISHQRHHAVVTFGDAELRVPPRGLPWNGPSYVNVVVGAGHRDASAGDVLLVGQNEKVPKVVQDMAGIRVVRFRPGDTPEPAPEVEATCLCTGIPVAKRQTVVLSHELAELAEGEQLLVRGRLVTDAAGLPKPARISTRMFLAESPDQTEPGGAAGDSVTWKGHLSKFTGFNCIPGEGPQSSSKYGVATVRGAPGRSLYVNLVAVSAAPFGGIAADAQLAIDTAASSLAVTRFLPG